MFFIARVPLGMLAAEVLMTLEWRKGMAGSFFLEERRIP